jgi:hypothetical protein
MTVMRYGSITIKTVILDAGELVWSKAPSQTTPVSGSFTVANTAITGRHV